MLKSVKLYLLSCLLLLSFGNARASVTLKIGETYTCILTNVPTHLQGCQWTSSRPYDVSIISTVSTYSTRVTIKALRSFSGAPCVIHCRYDYLELDPTTGRYIYSRSGYQDWNIFVHSVEPTSVSLNTSNITLNIGGTANLFATMSPSEAVSELTWRTSSSSVAAVTQLSETQARVTAKGSGGCIITVTTANGCSASCTVSVNPVDPTGITVTPKTIEIPVGVSKSLSYSLSPSGASSAVSWHSEDDSIATISQDGIVTGIKPGQTTVSAKTSNGYSASASIMVWASVETISLKDTDVNEGYSVKMIPITTPGSVKTTFTWTTSDSNIATVNQTGVVSAKKTGQVTIKVKTDNGKSAEATVNVLRPQDEVNIRNTKQRLIVLEKLLGKIR